MTEAEREAVHGVCTRLERRWVLPIPDGDVWHPYDPLPFWEFLAGVRTAETLTAGRTFLDLGCGIGTKLALMHQLGWQTAGVEHHFEYVLAARELIPEASIVVDNILNIDHFDADLIYMYRPAVGDALEDQVERHVLACSAPGTVMFWPLRHAPEVWVI